MAPVITIDAAEEDNTSHARTETEKEERRTFDLPERRRSRSSPIASEDIPMFDVSEMALDSSPSSSSQKLSPSPSSRRSSISSQTSVESFDPESPLNRKSSRRLRSASSSVAEYDREVPEQPSPSPLPKVPVPSQSDGLDIPPLRKSERLKSQNVKRSSRPARHSDVSILTLPKESAVERRSVSCSVAKTPVRQRRRTPSSSPPGLNVGSAGLPDKKETDTSPPEPDSQSPGATSHEPQGNSPEPDLPPNKEKDVRRLVLTEECTHEAFKLHPYAKIQWSSREIDRRITKVLFAGFTGDEPKDDKGYVYVFSWEGSKAHVKIGSSMDPLTRKDQISGNGSVRLEYEKTADEFPFKYYGIAERVVHAELCQLRRIAEYMENGKNLLNDGRKEWFEVAIHETHKVIAKWRNWFHNENPFDDQGQLKPFWRWWFGQYDFNHGLETHKRWEEALQPPSRFDKARYRLTQQVWKPAYDAWTKLGRRKFSQIPWLAMIPLCFMQFGVIPGLSWLAIVVTLSVA